MSVLGEKGHQDEGAMVFNPITPENDRPRLSLLACRFPPDGRFSLNVWALRRDKLAKALNIEWLGEEARVVAFKRGEWEAELLAMTGLGVH